MTVTMPGSAVLKPGCSLGAFKKSNQVDTNQYVFFSEQ